ncbi:MAG TPA: hypothetical protein DCS93_01335 [Microscillaceae bacterium]|nr:hypothetical protein [Microscillaceae bacterium]
MKKVFTLTLALIGLIVLNTQAHSLYKPKPSIAQFKNGEKFTVSTYASGCFAVSSTLLVIEKTNKGYLATYDAGSTRHDEILKNKKIRSDIQLRKKLTKTDLTALLAWEKQLLQREAKNPSAEKISINYHFKVTIANEFSLMGETPPNGYYELLYKIFGKKING